MNGRLDGENTGYFSDGSIQHKYHYHEGKKTGTNYDYFPGGKVQHKEIVATQWHRRHAR